MAYIKPDLVDQLDRVPEVIDCLEKCRNRPTSLFCDLEGNDLGRNGTLSLVTLLIDLDALSPTTSSTEKKLFVIDMKALGPSAFSTPNHSGLTLKAVFESPEITKVFFDIRTDSDALCALHGVHVRGIEDLQLMELRLRFDWDNTMLRSLARCIAKEAELEEEDLHVWNTVKDCGRDLCRYGYAKFDERPLRLALLDYAAQDVSELPTLWRRYRHRLSEEWWAMVLAETEARVADSHTDDRFRGLDPREGPEAWLDPYDRETRRKRAEEKQEESWEFCPGNASSEDEEKEEPEWFDTPDPNIKRQGWSNSLRPLSLKRLGSKLKAKWHSRSCMLVF